MQTEQRLVDTLIKHWRRRKGSLSVPVYEQFAPDALSEEIWQNCSSFQLQKSANKWIYTNEFTGEALKKAVGRDMRGEVFSLGVNAVYETRLLEKSEETLRKADPTVDEGHFVNELDTIIKFRCCLLPFGRAKNFTHIVVGVSWRAF